ADENGTSIKVAKYSGINRVDLVESNEYGYCSLIKATKSVLDKLDLENRTATKITSKERIDTRLWDGIALREAVINAIIHNDYTREIPPKFEIFSDRLEITSYGGLFEGMTREDFFEGLSLPRNKELMRVYKDLDMVEQLGSGVPRILQAYDKSCFKFSDNFTRMTLPNSVVEDNQDADQREIMEIDAPDLQELRKEFGLISERTQKNHEENIQFLRGIYGAFTGYLRGNYGITAEKLRNEFGERLIFILELMLIDEYATRQNFADILGASLSTIEKNIKILRDKNIIERRGSDKTGYWQILNQN
nr:hypothetical protein [Bacteroidales bacterium]